MLQDTVASGLPGLYDLAAINFCNSLFQTLIFVVVQITKTVCRLEWFAWLRTVGSIEHSSAAKIDGLHHSTRLMATLFIIQCTLDPFSQYQDILKEALCAVPGSQGSSRATLRWQIAWNTEYSHPNCLHRSILANPSIHRGY